MNRAEIARSIAAARVIAVVRLGTASSIRDVVHALVEGGIRVVELTMTVPDALNQIRRLATSLPSSVVLGAGTVMDKETAAAALESGARFVVSPVCRPALIDECHRRDRVMMPGCLTPTEILTAWDAGADFVKVFPASAVGPSFIRDIRGPLPDVQLVPTGGIGVDDAVEWLRAGAAAVGVGGALLDKQAIAAGDFGAVTALAERLVTQVRETPLPSPGSGGR